MSDLIKVGFLLSYDYEYLKYSLPCVYGHADSITLAMDQDFRTWSGNHFTIDPLFFEWISEFDIDKKISIYKDSFYVPELSPMECDTRQRNLLAKYMGEGGWHLQIDADEYFIDFARFKRFLKTKKNYLDNSQKTPVSFVASWVTLYKKAPEGFFFIKGNYEDIPLATNYPNYLYARNTDNPLVYTNFFLFHQTWARTEEEISFKLNNWGHKDDFDPSSYLELWKNLNEMNYEEYENFHPLWPSLWPALGYVEGNNLDMLLKNVKKQVKLSHNPWRLWLRNTPKAEKSYKTLASLRRRMTR